MLQCYTMLYYAILCYTILHYVILYYTVAFCAQAIPSNPPPLACPMGTPKYGTPAYYSKLRRNREARAKLRAPALARKAAVQQLLRKCRAEYQKRIKKVQDSARAVHLGLDAWKSTISAVKSMKYQAAPPVNHSVGFREISLGFHSNDIESDFAHMKAWRRQRYGRLATQGLGPETDGDMYEYAFYVNIGSGLHAVLQALRAYQG